MHCPKCRIEVGNFKVTLESGEIKHFTGKERNSGKAETTFYGVDKLDGATFINNFTEEELISLKK